MKFKRTLEEALVWIGGIVPSDIVCPNLERGLIETIARLPDDVFEELDRRQPTFMYPVDASFALRFVRSVGPGQSKRKVLPGLDGRRHYITEVEFTVVVFRDKIEDAPYAEIIGECAHELAHVVLGHDDLGGDWNGRTAEFDASAEAIRWGFGEVVAAVKATERRLKGDPAAMSEEDSWADCIARLPELEALAAAGE